MKYGGMYVKDADPANDVERFIGTTTAAVYATIVTAAAQAGVPDALLPTVLISVASSLVVQVGGDVMAYPSCTTAACEWAKEFGEQLPVLVAQAATRGETKQ